MKLRNILMAVGLLVLAVSAGTGPAAAAPTASSPTALQAPADGVVTSIPCIVNIGDVDGDGQDEYADYCSST